MRRGLVSIRKVGNKQYNTYVLTIPSEVGRDLTPEMLDFLYRAEVDNGKIVFVPAAKLTLSEV